MDTSEMQHLDHVSTSIMQEKCQLKSTFYLARAHAQNAQYTHVPTQSYVNIARLKCYFDVPVNVIIEL